MNRRPFLCLLLLLTLLMSGRTQPTEDGLKKAAEVVNDYYRMLNLESICADSILFIDSRIVHRGSTDTLHMLRWIAPGQRMRIEFTADDTLQRCYFSDGRHIYEEYDPEKNGWRSINGDTYHDAVDRYDYRGPLFQWQLRGLDLIYEEPITFEGVPAERVSTHHPEQYDRHYFFERASRLLFMYTESDSIGGKPPTLPPRGRVDWHAYHEYQPIGNAMLPSVESYQYQGIITIIFNTIRYVRYDERLFTERKRP